MNSQFMKLKKTGQQKLLNKHWFWKSEKLQMENIFFNLIKWDCSHVVYYLKGKIIQTLAAWVTDWLTANRLTETDWDPLEILAHFPLRDRLSPRFELNLASLLSLHEMSTRLRISCVAGMSSVDNLMMGLDHE